MKGCFPTLLPHSVDHICTKIVWLSLYCSSFSIRETIQHCGSVLTWNWVRSCILSLNCVCVCGWVGAKFVQSCPTLCNPMDRCPPCSSVHVILQTRIRSGLPYPSLGDLPNLGTEAATLMSPLLAGGFFTTSATSVAPLNCVIPVTFLMCFELQLLHLFSP